MKLTTASFILILFLYACKKNTSGDNNKPISTFATSIHISYLNQHELEIDSFIRDNSNRLIKLVRTFADSTTLPVKPTSNYYTFNYSGNDTLPDQFILSNSDVHRLRYDNQKRIFEDSSTTGHIIYYFSYASSKIFLYLDLLPSIGHYEDTLEIQNDNIAVWRYCFFAPTYKTYRVYNNTYTSLANPLSFHGNMGILLFDITGEKDYFSRNLISDGTTWATDQYGRVTNGINTATKNLIAYKYD